MLGTLVEAIERNAVDNPKKAAVCFRKERITYTELWKLVQKGSLVLRRAGIKPGDRVMISAVSKPEYIIALLSVQFIGAVSVAVDKTAKPALLDYIYTETEASFFLANMKSENNWRTLLLKEFVSEIESLSILEEEQYVKKEENDLCEILFTTGTTGKPKGVMLSYAAVHASMENTWHGIEMISDDVVLMPLPLNHSFGMRVLRSTLYIGATVVLQNGFTFVKEIETNIHDHACTAFISVPASIEMLLNQMADRFSTVFGKLRYMEFSAGSVSSGTKKRLLDLLPGVTLHNTWGSTETGGAIFLNFSKHPDKIDSIGCPISGVELKIMNSDGTQISGTGSGFAGRMVLKGDMQMSGYWRQHLLSEETIQDGWLYTNDLVYRDDDGYIYMLGRADDIINVGGEKVSPIEVENIAFQYEGVKDCACIGVSDPEGLFGQIPVLYVVSDEKTYNEKDMVDFLLSRLPRHSLPKKFIEVEQIPRNWMGKLDRKALHSMWEQMGDESLVNPVIRTLFTRRSIREFGDKEIPMPIMEIILKAGRYAPSGHNMQTWRFTVIRNSGEIARIKEIVGSTAKEKKVYFYGFQNPQNLILISNDRRNRYGIQDASCAAENIMLAAWSYGIGSVWLNPLMTLCDEPEIREILDGYGIASEHIVWAMIAIGYPKNSGKLLAKKEDVIGWVI